MYLTMDTLQLFIEKIKEIPNMHPRTSKTAVWVTLSLIVLYSQTIGKLIHPPRNVRHIPHVNYLKFIMMAMIQKQPFGAISRTLTMPLLDRSPMYMKPDRLGWTVYIATPEAAKQFFLKTDIYAKSDISLEKDTLFHDFIGPKNILFANKKEEWKKHRKLVNPAFHKSKPLKTFGNLAHKVFNILDDANETPVNITLLMERYTLDVIGHAGFGFDFDSILHDNNDWVNIYNGIKDGITDPVFFLFPWLDKYFRWMCPTRRHRHHLVSQFHDMLSGVIEKKRQLLQQEDKRDEAEKDLLTLMLESEFSEGGNILTDEEIKSNLNVFFLAGHDTTANALSFAIHALARDPALQQKARDEVIHILGDAPHDVLPTSSDLKQLEYLNWIIKETLRFNGPSTGGMPRRLTCDTNLMGVALPKGTPIMCSIYDMHHNPHVWDDPETYDPSRFAPGGEADQKAASRDGGAMAWSPFFNGQRMCIGMQFSLEEQRVMLSCLCKLYHVLVW
ncbi:unnamed protein product [Absidia cylindrospora]